MVAPIQNAVNPVLNVIGAIPIVGQVLPPLTIDVAGLLANAAAGQPITLQALDLNGNAVGPASQCDTTSDSIGLNTPAGIAIGGNKITGLGATNQLATAADINAIALGNNAAATAGATGSVAIGAGASVSAANSVALGAGSVATRGAQTSYTAAGLTAAQTSVGEVSVGIAGGARQITNVAAGSAANDAVNVAQLLAVSAGAANAVQYDVSGTTRLNSVTLVGGAAGTVAVRNVAAGTVAATSTDAVNGSQLFATNTNVTNNATAITNLTTNINNGTIGLVQQTGGAPGAGDITVGAATGGQVVNVGGTSGDRRVTSVAAGIATTDAVNVGQLTAVSAVANNSVQYDVDGSGNRLNSTTLVGGNTGPVAVRNVAAGTLSAASTDAVNGSQLFATNTQITANTTVINNIVNGTAGLVQQVGGAPGSGKLTVGAATGGTIVDFTGTDGTRTLTGVTAGVNATDAVNVSQLASVSAVATNSVQYDLDTSGNRTNSVTLVGGNTGAPVTIRNVAPGAVTATSTDAVNGAQLFATNTQVTTNTTNIAGNTTAITNLTTGINNGTIGLVQQVGGSPGSGAITVGAATGGTTVNVAGTSGARTISGVAAGVAATDAVNVGQLASLGQTVNGAVQYDRNADGTVNRTSITLNPGGSPGTIGNVANGTRASDAVNLGQLQSGLSSTLNQANTYTDARINALSFDLNKVAKRAYAGTASALALQAPAFIAPGQIALRAGSGYYRGEVAFGAGLRATADNGRWSLSGGVSGGRNSGVAASAGIDIVLGN